MTAPTVFISYSHKDEDWKDRLVSHLGVPQHEGLLDLWDDRRIGGGEDWYEEIQEAMTKASVAILLVSANFLTSKFILEDEVTRLMERREKEGMRIFPVIVKPCAWNQVKWLSSMNLQPKDGKALSGGNEHKIDTDLAAIANEIAALIESKNHAILLETVPEKISISQLQSIDSNISGHEMKSNMPQPEIMRIQHLADSIKKDYDLLKEYEDTLRLENDPRRRARYRREIEQLRESAANYKREYDKLHTHVSDKTSMPMQNMGIQLQQIDGKLDTLLEGQETIQDNLINLRKALLARFDANEQIIITTIVDRLDQEQLANTQDVLNSIANKQLADKELHETLAAIRDTINEIRQQGAFISDSNLNGKIEKMSDIVDSPKLDVSHKLKVTVPIIPLILSYEGELGLKSGMNLESAWKKLLNKVRGEQ